MSRSKKDAVGGHRKATAEEVNRRHWRMIPYGRGHFSFYQDFRSNAETRAMRGSARMRDKTLVRDELQNAECAEGER